MGVSNANNIGFDIFEPKVARRRRRPPGIHPSGRVESRDTASAKSDRRRASRYLRDGKLREILQMRTALKSPSAVTRVAPASLQESRSVRWWDTLCDGMVVIASESQTSRMLSHPVDSRGSDPRHIRQDHPVKNKHSSKRFADGIESEPVCMDIGREVAWNS